MTSLDFDVFDPAQTHDMWELMREFRQREPIARIQGGFVYVSRYEHARAALKDEATFSNVGGMRPTGLEIPIHDASIGELGPPVHAPARKLATVAAQGGGVMKRVRPFVRETAESLLDVVAKRGSGDLIAEYSLQLTARVISWLLGTPMQESARLAAWGEEIMSSPLTVTNRTERGVGYAGAFPEFTRHLEQLVEERLTAEASPEDTIGRILAVRPEGFELTVPNVRMVLLNLVLGGTATTRDLIGNLLLEILERPELHEQLSAHRELVPAAVEESLRLSPPVLYLIRTCTRAAELGGVEIAANERVVVGLASANRDESVYEEADQFRVDRTNPAPHLSFGHGQHFCVGAPLARLEAQEAVDVFLDRFAPGQVRLASGFERAWMPLPYMLGPVNLEIETRTPLR
jgi:cytochrome P450